MKLKKTKLGFDPLAGYQNMCKKQRSLTLVVLGAMLFVFVLGIFASPLSHVCVAGSGTIMASMMAIGSIDDVSDRDTHGNNLAYCVYLIDISQIDKSVSFPQPNANREVGTVPMKTGEYMQYFEAHSIPTYSGKGDKGDITTTGTNTFVIVMGGCRDKVFDFHEQHLGGKFVILFKEIKSSQWYILGELERPMILKTSEIKNDADGRYTTFTFERSSVDQYYKYAGSIVSEVATTVAAGSTTLAITKSSMYDIPGGTSATYAINAVSGLTASDIGRFITLYGKGTTNIATIADGASFVLAGGTTWTANAGSQIIFRVLDTTTLVEVSRADA